MARTSDRLSTPDSFSIDDSFYGYRIADIPYTEARYLDVTVYLDAPKNMVYVSIDGHRLPISLESIYRGQVVCHKFAIPGYEYGVYQKFHNCTPKEKIKSKDEKLIEDKKRRTLCSENLWK